MSRQQTAASRWPYQYPSTSYQALQSLSDLVRVFGDDCLVQAGDVSLDLILHILRNLRLVLRHLLLGVVDALVSFVLHVDCLSSLLISLLGSLSVLDHLLDIGVTETTTRSHSDRLSLAGTLVLGRNVESTVGVDVESNLNLRNTSWSHWNTTQLEVTQFLVISSHLSFTLQNSDSYLSLIVSSG